MFECSFVREERKNTNEKNKDLELTLLPRYIRFVPDFASIAYKFHIDIGYLLRFGVRMDAGAPRAITLNLRRKLPHAVDRSV